MNPIRKEFQYGDQLVTLETGEIARQADGAVMIDVAGTTLLVTVVAKKEANGGDFFPLALMESQTDVAKEVARHLDGCHRFQALRLACDLVGDALWAKAYGSGEHEGMSIAADTLGNVFVSGRMWGALYLPDDTLNSVSANNDILLMGLDTAGTFRWAMSTGSSQNDVAYGVAADGLGNAYVSAQFPQTIDFFGTPLTALGSEDLLVARVTNLGAVSWVKQGGGFMRDIGLCVHRSTVGSDPVYVGGYYFGPATYGSSTIDDVLNGDAMMAQLSDTTIVDIVTVLPQNARDQDIMLFPSPAGDRISLRSERPIARAWIVSSFGSFVQVQLDQRGSLEVQHLAPGLYFLRATLDDGRVISEAFVKE